MPIYKNEKRNKNEENCMGAFVGCGAIEYITYNKP